MKTVILLGIVLLASIFLIRMHRSNIKTPEYIGMNEHRFSPCPNSPNCVSSQSDTDSHNIPAISASGNEQKVMNRLQTAVSSMQGASIIKIDGNYLHAEFKSTVFRFIDDLECYYVPNKNIIHIKSASRLGYYDFGINRKRIETLRARFTSEQQSML